ncbi:MAG: MmcQ/YjbR family DNA-binding protein [Rhodospirillales bacterium]
MNRKAFNAYCRKLPHTTHVVQWGGSDVWKVGGKVFAVAGLGGGEDNNLPGITFKVSDMVYEILRRHPGCRPAPYLAPRGMTWIQRFEPGLPDKDLREHLIESHRLVARGLTKKLQRELGLALD